MRSFKKLVKVDVDVPEILNFSYYANLATDDVTSCASTVV